jgi:hypothetical protein
MRTVLAALVCGVLLLGGPALHGQGKKDGPTPSFMARKLMHAKDLLEGIALSDFKKIDRSADELLRLTNAEEWRAIKTARYEMFSNEFRRAAEGIIQKARAKNIDGVTVSYFEMTVSCVRCHSYVREVREARLPGAPALAARHAPGRGEVRP